ncbi:endo-1,4-beta-xylanase [Anoxybacillus sp. LAT_35]|uniref:endo-1,4-beta-xylanase n=1 Tax=unclassified Anoxybacillus TaxID=2639704 RepID=UPI001EDB966D|nr:MULTISPECIES: endo-1,4-beta-xylanase [unclassified Anoxybacillus]MCG5024200.1 endo-1,4-beta-xylanase [Anoxybacillus flavithermus]MCG3086104.1 endo-1,4-beta-xylanase [Anoxybacillus sp. LAT27]MCG6172898.1 endo-1,4-beta-xylanase [Anoxybacillus sp. LAT_11]MCG6173528.1 endo-1,4-beta-xylanase [Anoxybacillus sp. LAT_11]MCG6173910.1 endo-1,4-beta-xylanase [Anoxybacillus sp. LAT_31]
MIPSLREVYKEHFRIGAAVSPITIKTQKDLLVSHVNSITAENHMKFEHLQPKEGEFTFEQADEIVHFALSNNMVVRGHTLVWHNQTPPWMFYDGEGKVVGKELLFERLKAHISTVIQRYKGKVYCWDVVNEAVADEGNDLLRISRWSEIAGMEFIEKAFLYAREADPNALLFYNDYNESFPEKREKIYKLVKSLLEKHIPVDGIGLQAHWSLTRPTLEEIRLAIERYASLGVQLHITELDISMFEFDDHRNDLIKPTDQMVDKQAERYDQIFSLFKEYSDVIRNVTFWGIADDYTWLDNFPVKQRKNWPFLFDENHQPKPAFWKVCTCL